MKPPEIPTIDINITSRTTNLSAAITAWGREQGRQGQPSRLPNVAIAPDLGAYDISSTCVVGHLEVGSGTNIRINSCQFTLTTGNLGGNLEHNRQIIVKHKLVVAGSYKGSSGADLVLNLSLRPSGVALSDMFIHIKGPAEADYIIVVPVTMAENDSEKFANIVFDSPVKVVKIHMAQCNVKCPKLETTGMIQLWPADIPAQKTLPTVTVEGLWHHNVDSNDVQYPVRCDEFLFKGHPTYAKQLESKVIINGPQLPTSVLEEEYVFI
jgi:hypothetical protein